MSLTLGIYKGRTYQDSEFIDDRPVSFFRVWKKVWSPVIAACGGRLFQDCSYFRSVRYRMCLQSSTASMTGYRSTAVKTRNTFPGEFVMS